MDMGQRIASILASLLAFGDASEAMPPESISEASSPAPTSTRVYLCIDQESTLMDASGDFVKAFLGRGLRWVCIRQQRM